MALRLTQATYPRAAGDAPAAAEAAASAGTQAPGVPDPPEATALPDGATGTQSAAPEGSNEVQPAQSEATATAQAAPPSADPEPATTETPALTAATDPAALASALLLAVQESARQAEADTLRAMAARSGLPEASLSALLREAQQKQRGEMPLSPAVRARLIAAEVKGVGADMGLLDADAAARLMEPDAVTVDAQGAVTGVREALAALKGSKGYLFGQPARGAWAQPMGGGAQPLGGVEEAFYRKNPALRK